MKIQDLPLLDHEDHEIVDFDSERIPVQDICQAIGALFELLDIKLIKERYGNPSGYAKLVRTK